MPRLSFIYRTDVHVCDKSPISWKGDYPSEIWSNLEQIGRFAKKFESNAVLDGGDYFHIKAASRNPHALVRRSAEIQSAYPCGTWCVEGNHDIQFNNLDTLDRQPLGVLYATGVFHHLREQVFKDGDLQVRVVGVPYSPTRTREDLLSIKKKPGDTYLVAIVHSLAGENPPASVEDFFNEPVFRYADLVSPDGPDTWCFPSETPILDTLYRPIRIDCITEGVEVLGRLGSTTVEAVHPTRNISEDLVCLNIEGVPPLVPGATLEHPYWVARDLHCVLPSRSTRRCHPDKPKGSHPCNTCVKAPDVKAIWTTAGQIEVGDFVAIPVPNIPADALSEPGLARLLGYYAAEGHILTNLAKDPVAGVAWSFHEDEEGLHEDVKQLVRKYFGLDTHNHPTTGKCIQVCAYGREIAEFFCEHGGRYSDEKSLSFWIWQQSAAARMEFLIGWLLGDGHARSSRTEIGGATASQALAFQVFFLALSIGLRPYFTVRPPPLSKPTNFPSNIVSFYGDDGEKLSHLMGVTPPERSKTKVAGFFLEGLYYARVREVSRWHYAGPVHNFRTSTGEYIAGGVLVHNCFGHWHQDQGIVQLGGKTFVNQGAISRGSLIRENLERTPKAAHIEADEHGIRVTPLPLLVLPAAEVFDLERKTKQEEERANIDQFIDKLILDGTFDTGESIETNIRSMTFAENVRDLALWYLNEVGEVG